MSPTDKYLPMATAGVLVAAGFAIMIFLMGVYALTGIGVGLLLFVLGATFVAGLKE